MFGGGGTPSKDHEGDTFLTDLMMGKRPPESARKKSNQSAMKSNRDYDQSEQDLDEELRDVVFDYENSQALVHMANNFLEDDTRKRPQSDTHSMYSKMSGKSTMSSKVRDNKNKVGEYDPYKVKLMQDRLSVKEKERL